MKDSPYFDRTPEMTDDDVEWLHDFCEQTERNGNWPQP